ncbi:MAG: tRNA (adenosine(37)-N6)-threonylcarbamoyltransferase complex dimerization subunit type 1 TsaB [Rikenellaceae bacterium]|nr:tRNA (adenosine(37)-N6)-threonylcarbamoyltransferase complex dimerization subunit type 1 TsaB [Rikenellaceae bacterium]MCL2692797.1 tRNA (adenosine(37)-N6)-threonylcarbamoyltransferase complex dimerization subunit type 1 TsaB [Rikenellaceae bacterium]
MSLILGIETGTDVCSVSLARGRQLIALRESGEGYDHARLLATYIDEVLRSNDFVPEDLSAVAVSSGPGSYTGLRIGISTAKGLCYGLGIPLIAVGSLESLARVAAEDHEAGILDIANDKTALLCPMIDARRMEVYAQVFDMRIEPQNEVGAYIIDSESFAEFRPSGREFVIFGNGAAKCADMLSGAGVRFAEVAPSARGLVGPAFAAFEAGRFEDIAYFEPFYLKDFVVTTATRARGLLPTG